MSSFPSGVKGGGDAATIADLNQDDYVEVIFPNGWIYWGGPDGTYNESRRSSLPAESSGALTVADLNQDGWMDMVVYNHIVRGDHGAGTNIFWGGPQGFSSLRSHWLQTFGPHFGVRRDIGNIYHRRLEEEYKSPALKSPAGKAPSRLSWKARTPHGTAVRFQIRSATSPAELEKASWHGAQGPRSYYQSSPAVLKLPKNHRWVQYRAVLSTLDGGSTPVLEEVQIDVTKP